MLMTASAFSQTADMESFIILPDSALFGAEQVTDGDTTYTQDFWSFENNWNASWSSFAGFAFSNITDNTTPGYGNQFSAIPGSGNGSSSNYAICYISGFNNNRIFYDDLIGPDMMGAYVTNTTYAYYSMLNGDSFAKKFGEDTSATGVIDGTNGEDWFLLTVYALGGDSLHNGDSVNFYLADYRFSDDALDYIIDEWTFLDLTSVHSGFGFDFALSSSDTTGGFGMNTPAYFALDDLDFMFSGLTKNDAVKLSVYPNPTAGDVFVKTEPGTNLQVLDMLGRIVYSGISDSHLTTITLDECPSGLYVVTAERNGLASSQRLVIR